MKGLFRGSLRYRSRYNLGTAVCSLQNDINIGNCYLPVMGHQLLGYKQLTVLPNENLRITLGRIHTLNLNRFHIKDGILHHIDLRHRI